MRFSGGRTALSKAGLVAALAASVLALGATTSAWASSNPGAVWAQTDANGAASRANLADTSITTTNANQIAYRAQIVAPTDTNDGCGPSGLSNPIAVPGRLYAISNGVLTAYKPNSGASVWQTTPDPSFSTYYVSLATVGNLVLVGELDCGSVSDPNGYVQAFDTTDGHLVWTHETGSALTSMVVSGNYIAETGETLGSGQYTSVLAVSTGAVVWSAFGGNDCAQTALFVVGGQVVWNHCSDVDNTSTLEADQLATGTTTWTRAGSWTVQRGDSDATGTRHLYAADSGGIVRDLNPATGATRFALSSATTVLAVDATRVYARCGSSVCGYTESSGAKVWARSDASTLAAVTSGVLFLGDGKVLRASSGAVLTRPYTSSTTSALSVAGGRVFAVTSPQVLNMYALPGWVG